MAASGLTRANKLATEVTGYAKLRKAAEAQVARWGWASRERFSPEPHYFESHKLKRGRALKSKPPGNKVEAEEGFDAEDRVVVVRVGTTLPGKQYTTFYRYERDGVARFHYHYDEKKPWIHVAWFPTDGERILAAHFVYRAPKGHRSRVFSYDDKGLATGYVETGVMDGERVSTARDFDYDAKGRLARVWWRYDDGRRVLYWQNKSAAR